MPPPIERAPNGPILCFGEILWDILPTGRFPGGAPANVAFHLRQLGLNPLIVSAIGNDELGEALLKQLSAWGLESGGIIHDAGKPTGTVEARLSAMGDAHYEIRRDVAWDEITISAATARAAPRARAFVFGSLAQRSQINRQTLRALLNSIPSTAERVFDVNLRPPHDDLQLVRDIAASATVLKLNSAEAARLAGGDGKQSDERDARQLAEMLGIGTICITAGERGAGLLQNGKWIWENARPVQVVDTVGSGDAFLAAFLAARLRGDAPAVSLAQACRLGEWVASQRGATPVRSK